jgi:hypothetical protein
MGNFDSKTSTTVEPSVQECYRTHIESAHLGSLRDLDTLLASHVWLLNLLGEFPLVVGLHVSDIVPVIGLVGVQVLEIKVRCIPSRN